MPIPEQDSVSKQSVISNDQQVSATEDTKSKTCINENSNNSSSILGALGVFSESSKEKVVNDEGDQVNNQDLPLSTTELEQGKESLNFQTDDQEDNDLSGSEPEVEPEVVNICQLRSASQFNLAIQVDDKPIRAVVDSAAEVTIISDRIYQSLGSPPQKVKDVTLLTAGRQMAMKGFIAGPVKLKIGNKWYQENVYIAPIEQLCC